MLFSGGAENYHAPMPVAQVSEGSKSVKKVALPRRPRTAHNTARLNLLFYFLPYLAQGRRLSVLAWFKCACASRDGGG